MVICQNCEAQVTGDICQNCGQAVTQYQQVPQPYYQQPMPPPYYPPLGPPPKSNMNVVVIIVVFVFLIFASIAILYSLTTLHVNTTTTPRGSLLFADDPNVPGRWTGTFQGSVRLEKIDIVLYDASWGMTEVEEQPQNGAVLSITNGCNLTFTDFDANNKLDETDSLLVDGGGPGDRITIVFRSTGETVATFTLN